MKTRLYRKLVRFACKVLGISRKRLFARDFGECVFPVYHMIDHRKYTVAKDDNRLIVVRKKTPLSQLYEAADIHRIWISKHWRKLSRHRAFIQVNIDLGMPEHKAVEAYFEAEDRKKCTMRAYRP